MTDDEFQIVNFLKASPETAFTRREIARKAVHRRVFEENPHWADAPLTSLVARKVVEQLENGTFQLPKDRVLAGL